MTQTNSVRNPKSFKVLVGIFIVVIAIIATAFIFVEKVPEGKVAVVYSPNGGATVVIMDILMKKTIKIIRFNAMDYKIHCIFLLPNESISCVINK